MESFDNLSDLVAAIENHGARSHIESRDPLVLSWSVHELHIEKQEDGFHVSSHRSNFIDSDVDAIYIGDMSDVTEADVEVCEKLFFFEVDGEMRGISFI